MSIDIDNRHPKLRVGQARLAKHLRGVLREVGRGRAHVDVSLVTDREIRKLNKQFRGVDAVTDVLSFALTEGEGPPLPGDWLGDVVVSLDTARRQAAQMQSVQMQARTIAADPTAARAWRLTEEVMFLATHGVLHLVGHDHEDPAEAEVMEALERKLLLAVTPLDVHGLDRTTHGR